MRVAERGLHVWCEKPLAHSLRDAERIVAAIRAAVVVGTVNYELRMKETRRRLVERARAVVGKPRMVAGERRWVPLEPVAATA